MLTTRQKILFTGQAFENEQLAAWWISTEHDMFATCEAIIAGATNEDTRRHAEADAWDIFVKEIKERHLPHGWEHEARRAFKNVRQSAALTEASFEEYFAAKTTAAAALQYSAKPLGSIDIKDALLEGSHTLLETVMLARAQTMANLDSPNYTITQLYTDMRSEWKSIVAFQRYKRPTLNDHHDRSRSGQTTSTRTALEISRKRDTVRRNSLTEEEKSERFRRGTCYDCGERGHIARDCRNRRKPWTTSDTTKRVKAERALVTDTRDEVASNDSEEECVVPSLPPLSIGTLRLDGKPVRTFVDTCSSTLLISDELVQRHKLPVKRLARTVRLEGVEDAVSGCLKQGVSAFISSSNPIWKGARTNFVVAKLPKGADLIVGAPFIARHKLLLSMAEPQSVRMQDVGIELVDKMTSTPPRVEVAKTITAAIAIKDSIPEEPNEDERKTKLRDDLLRKFTDVFPPDLPTLRSEETTSSAFNAKSIPDSARTTHKIALTTDRPIINGKSYSVPRRWIVKFKQILDRLETQGRIRRAQDAQACDIASPSFLIRKADPKADPRLVTDFRNLNSFTVKDREPTPFCNDLLELAAEAKWRGKSDLRHAFWQTLMEPDHVRLTAFKTPFGLYEWVVMPMGICNEGATHQRRINAALAPYLGKICAAYSDDLIVWGDTIDEMRERWHLILTRLREHRMYLSGEKTEFAADEVGFLGHRISTRGIEVDPRKSKRIEMWPTPRRIRDIRSFMGLVQYLRRFIPGLEGPASVLSRLIRKHSLWAWDDTIHGEAFRKIKFLVAKTPIITTLKYDSDEPIWLICDASKTGVGAMLRTRTDVGNGATSGVRKSTV